MPVPNGTGAASPAPNISASGSGLPTRIIFYGVEKIGKTLWASHSARPVFGMSIGETGLLTLIDAGSAPETPHFDEFLAWEDLPAAVKYLTDNDTGHKTFVLDTMNGSQTMMFENVCRRFYEGNWKAFNAYGGKGVEDHALSIWSRFLRSLDRLRAVRKMQIILLCHARVRNFKNPEGEDFSRYSADMHDKIWGLTAKWADVILFAKTRTFAEKKNAADTRPAKGTSDGQRIIYTQWSPAWDAGSRYDLPAEIPMGRSGREAWANFAAAMKKAKKAPPRPLETRPTQQTENRSADVPTTPQSVAEADEQAKEQREAESVGEANEENEGQVATEATATEEGGV